MADTLKYFKAVKGITDGMVHHAEDEVFAQTDAILVHFDRTGGKNGDDVLYVEISADEFNKAEGDPVGDALLNKDGSVVLGAGAPSGTDVVGGGVYKDPAIDQDTLKDAPQLTTLNSGAAAEVPANSSVDKVIKEDGTPSSPVASQGAPSAPSASSTGTPASTSASGPTASTSASSTSSTTP